MKLIREAHGGVHGTSSTAVVRSHRDYPFRQLDWHTIACIGLMPHDADDRMVEVSTGV
jgi:hypothetical protein